MIQRWEIYNWYTNKRAQLCSSKEVAERLFSSHDEHHIVREIFFYDDGEFAEVCDNWEIGVYEHIEKKGEIVCGV